MHAYIVADFLAGTASPVHSLVPLQLVQQFMSRYPPALDCTDAVAPVVVAYTRR